MRKTALLIWIIIAGNFSTSVYSQGAAVQEQIKKLMPKPVAASPNVAALGKFGDYAVTAYNGLPDISIPIFEVKSGDLMVPISLKYHAGGIKRTDHASWVGAGWALQQGGQISRKINGQPDEADFYTTNTTPLQPTIALCSDPEDVPYLRQVAWGNLDTQPDIFSYSYPGKSGNFLLSSQALQPPYLVPYEPIVVNVVNFDNIKITGENGTLYQFGTSATGVAGGIEGTYTSAGSSQSSGATAWHLMQMTAPNTDDKIVFDYQNVGTVNYSDINDIIQISDLCFSDGTQGPCPSAQANGSNVNVGITTNPLGLQRITFETGMMEFVLSSGFRKDEPMSKSLDSINIYSTVNGVQKLIKVYKFQYSYFRNAANTADLMLRLDKIQMKNSVGAIIGQYKFTYETTYLSWDNNIRSRDYWGYYNGANNMDLIVPQQIIVQPQQNVPASSTITIGTANRTTNVQYLTEGVLKKIEFPTGGYSQFEYEVNKYKESNVNYTASGLRVSKITSSDGSGAPPIIKSYKYGSDELGYGDRNFEPNRFFANSEQLIISTCCLSGGCPGMPPPGTLRYRSRTWVSNSAYDIDGYSNAPVVYLYVSEYLLDEAGNSIGKTVYEYDNGVFFGTGVDLFVPFSTNYFRDSHAWKNGNLTMKSIYDKYGNKIQVTATSYSEYASQSKFVGYAANFYNTYTINAPCGVACDIEEMKFAYLSQSSGAIRQNGTFEYTYKNGDISKYVSKQSTSTNDPVKLQVLETTVIRSNSPEQLITVNKYPFQLTANTSSTGTAKGLYMLTNKNIFTTPHETFTYLQNSDGTNQRIISAQVTSFRQNASNVNQVVPDQIYLWESALPIAKTAYVPVGINGTNSGITMDPKFAQRINMVNYDDAGNILTVAKSNDVNVTYLYGYNKSLPVAEVRNATTSEVFYEGFETITNNGPGHTGVGLLKGTYIPPFVIPNSRLYTIEYWIRQFPNPVWNHVSADYSNGMNLISADYDDIRIYPKDALMKTYTYDPLLGMTSSINESGLTYLYDYDSFGRLSVIRNEKGNIEKQYSYHYKEN